MEHKSGKTKKEKNLNNKQSDTRKTMTYKGKRLIRKGKMLYYGNQNNKYIITIKILKTEQIKNLKVATKVSVELQKNDRSLKGKQRVVKKVERDGLYKALDIGYIWLEDAL